MLRHELFSSLPEQWVQWVDRLRFQPARQAAVDSRDGRGEEIRRKSLARYGIPYAEAERNVRAILAADNQGPSLDPVVSPYEVVAG